MLLSCCCRRMIAAAACCRLACPPAMPALLPLRHAHADSTCLRMLAAVRQLLVQRRCSPLSCPCCKFASTLLLLLLPPPCKIHHPSSSQCKPSSTRHYKAGRGMLWIFFIGYVELPASCPACRHSSPILMYTHRCMGRALDYSTPQLSWFGAVNQGKANVGQAQEGTRLCANEKMNLSGGQSRRAAFHEVMRCCVVSSIVHESALQPHSASGQRSSGCLLNSCF